MRKLALAILVGLFVLSPCGRAAELVLPQNRNAYLCLEPIELAIADLPAGAAAKIELVPKQDGIKTLSFEVSGQGSTVLAILPAYALAAGEYTIRLDGQESQKLTVASGANVSPMLLSETIGLNDLKRGGANFALGNAFSFGLLTPDGKPLTEGLRGRRSAGLNALEQALALDLPTLCYMYWTGYVTHKPWGSEKSWADEKMVETMRLFNFHTAQRLRRYREAIVSVGCLDEPGLAWGKTPAGGMASGFPNWDEQRWYESRGWQYTNDIAARDDDDDWMRYMAVRCAILKECMEQAKHDLKTVWPEMVFSTDLYAPQAIMDGTDPLNQEVNEVPSTHVFMDWGYGKLGVIGALYLEKAHQPAAKIAHAMNGQLFGKTVPQPAQRDAYRVMLNGMLAAGLKSNWWLNTGGMTPEDLAAINEPGQRLGPLFLEMSPEKHDVAVLWSFTEISMRERAIAAKEAKKKTGEQIKLMVAALPENTAVKEGQIDLNAYSVGGNYKEQVLSVHQALSRAGYPAHIVDERSMGRGLPHQYKTLVIVGQTHDLPNYARQAICDFSNAGGRVVIDRTTTATKQFDDVLVTEADFKDPAYRWTPLFVADKKSFKTPREASYFQTNYFMDELVCKAVEPLKKTLRETRSQPAIVTDSPHLAAERHVGGDGQLVMVLNGFERLPEIAESDEYSIYNYAPHEAQYTLSGLDASSVVYLIEGADWRTTRRVTDFDRPQSVSFAPGEMKLYLVAPREPGWRLGAEVIGGSVKLWAETVGVKMPWPLEVTVSAPDGRAVYHVYRATNHEGRWQETLAIGTNASPGGYMFRIKPLVGVAGAATTFDYQPPIAAPSMVADQVRVFDEAAVRGFLAKKPELRIALGADAQRASAEALKTALAAGGVRAEIVAEAGLLRKARYPRVWDPYIKVYQAKGAEQKPSGEVKLTATIETSDDGRQIVRTADGKERTEWRTPGTLLTISGGGFIDFDAEKFYEPGCVLYLGDNNQAVLLKGEPVEVRATDEVRRKWSRPWTRLNSFVGTDKLCPQLPEAYSVEEHLILLGDSKTSELVAALQASELLLEVVDEKYPGPGKALVSFAWSPFAVEKNVILVGASDAAGLNAGIRRLSEMLRNED